MQRFDFDTGPLSAAEELLVEVVKAQVVSGGSKGSRNQGSAVSAHAVCAPFLSPHGRTPYPSQRDSLRVPHCWKLDQSTSPVPSCRR
jgi:hypothetical protein